MRSHLTPIMQPSLYKGRVLHLRLTTGPLHLLPVSRHKRTWGSNLPPLCKSKLKLRTYTGQPIPHLGVLYVDTEAEVQKAKATLVIAKGSGPSLLGRDRLRKIRLNFYDIKYTSTADDIQQCYSDVFRAGYI